MVEKGNLSKSIELTLESTDKLIDQGIQIWQEADVLVFPAKYYQIENIVVCGMGGSSLPAHILSSVFQTKVPLTIVEGYSLPSWAGPKTLVILSSYSGDTEETLSCAVHAEENQCVITGITTGGNLEKFLKGGAYPYVLIDPRNNPSEAPRLGLGYGIFGILKMLAKLELIDKYDQEATNNMVKTSLENVRNNLENIKNKARELAPNLKNKFVITLVAEHLGGVARTLENQLNETAKAFCFYKHLPEADHNLIEGFSELQDNVAVIFLKSQKYTARIQRRMDITKNILEKNGFKTYSYETEAPVLIETPSLLEEALNTLVFSGNLSADLAMEKNVNPLDIPNIDNIKRELLGTY